MPRTPSAVAAVAFPYTPIPVVEASTSPYTPVPLVPEARPAFVGLSLVSGKQPYYLVPLLPALALLAARSASLTEERRRSGALWAPAALFLVFGLILALFPRLSEGWPIGRLTAGTSPLWGAGAGLALTLLWMLRRRPVAGLASAFVILFVVVHLSYVRALAPAFDLEPLAHKIAEIDARHAPVAKVGSYPGLVTPHSHLYHAIAELRKADAPGWVKAHPNGYLLVEQDAPTVHEREIAALVQPYRGHYLVLWSCSSLAREPGLMGSPRRDSCNRAHEDGNLGRRIILTTDFCPHEVGETRCSGGDDPCSRLQHLLH